MLCRSLFALMALSVLAACSKGSAPGFPKTAGLVQRCQS